MPRMVHIRHPITGGPVYVRAGSLATKPAWLQWRTRRKELREAPGLVHWIREALRWPERIVWPQSGESLLDDDEMELVYTDLEWLREEVNATLAAIETVVPLRRRIELLERTDGRTPAEAATFKAKAAELRRRLG